MEGLLHQINTRIRSSGAGAADFASSPAVENATKFIRSSKVVSESIASTRDSVAKNVAAAQSTVANNISFKLKLFAGGVVNDIATWHVKRNSPPSLSERAQMGLAIAQFKGKYPGQLPAGGDYKKLRENEPKIFTALLTILKNDDMNRNALSCSAEVQDFKKNPTMAKAQAIIDKYILDPKLGDCSNDKPLHINVYESQYQKLLVNFERAKFASAYQSNDAQEKLACIFDPILSVFNDVERGINNSIHTEIREFHRP
ncbi:hypothetical protein MCEGEM3_01599 [Oxalobacteraceae bacterium]